MISNRLGAALIGVVILGGASGVLSAQTRGAQSRPAPPDAVETTRDSVSVERQTDQTQTFRYHRPILRIFQDYTLSADDIVREAWTVFGDITVEGRVEGDVVVVMGSARLAPTAKVEGSLVVVGGSATIDAGAAVQRDMVVIGGTVTAPATFSPDGEHVVIGSPLFGDAVRHVMPWVTHGLLWGRLIVPGLEWVWAVVGIFFLVYLALNTVFDRPVAATADMLVNRPLSAFVGGLLVLVLSVPVLAIIAASVIGLAIVPFLLCGMVLAGLIGKAAVARAIGRGVIRSEPPEGRLAALVAFLIGSGLLVLAYMVPVLGLVTWGLASVMGLGAATATFRTHIRRERKSAAPPAAPVPEPSASPAVAAATVAQAPVMLDPPPTVPTAVEPPPALEVPVFEPPPPPPLFNQGLAQFPRATFLDRVAAFALDCILVAITNQVLFDVHRNDDLFPVLLLAYHIGFWAWRGTTLGGIICNLKVTRTDGTELKPMDAVVRGLSGIFSIAAVGIGCFWMLQDPERQMWHDKIAGTLVVKVPRHVVLP